MRSMESSTSLKIAMRLLLTVVLTISSFLPASGQVKRKYAPRENEAVVVTAGQTFYTEFTSVPTVGIKLERPFRSSMAGAMGFPFSFELMDPLLVPVAPHEDGWRYFAPKDGAFKASHGLLGSVIRPGDSVGIRISPNGEAEWFVDNSVYNGFRTIWSRKMKKKDPSYELVNLGEEVSGDLPIHRLVYLGVRDAQVRVRWDEVDPNFGQRSEEYSFPAVNKVSSVAVRGARFRLIVTDTGAEVTMLAPMTDGVGQLKERPLPLSLPPNSQPGMIQP